MLRWIEDPVFASVQRFGKSRAVHVPLHARAAIANAKRQCHWIILIISIIIMSIIIGIRMVDRFKRCGSRWICGGIVGVAVGVTRATQRKFVSTQKVLPFWTVRFSKQIPARIGALRRECFSRGPTFVEIILQRNGASVVGQSVAARQCYGKIGSSQPGVRFPSRASRGLPKGDIGCIAASHNQGKAMQRWDTVGTKATDQFRGGIARNVAYIVGDKVVRCGAVVVVLIVVLGMLRTGSRRRTAAMDEE